MLSDASDEIEEKSDAIFEAYRDDLATFGAEPEPLGKSSGLGVNGLLDWMLKEFVVLGNFMTNVSDNSAIVSCENAFALLKHEGCQDMGKLIDPRYELPDSAEIAACAARIQFVKRAFCGGFGCPLVDKLYRIPPVHALRRLGYYLLGCPLTFVRCFLTVLLIV